MEATDVRLDGSNLTSLDSTTFIGRGRLHKLYLSRCKITAIENQVNFFSFTQFFYQS